MLKIVEILKWSAGKNWEVSLQTKVVIHLHLQNIFLFYLFFLVFEYFYKL